MLLAYCVALPTAAELALPPGVGGSTLRAFEVDGLLCYYADWPTAAPTEASLKQAAFAFHRVNSAIFATIGIIPFRFPTLLADATALQQQLAQQAPGLRSALERLRDRVQMEVTLGLRGLPPAPGPASSGAEYLETRRRRQKLLEDAAAGIRAALAELHPAWRTKALPEGGKLFALVERRAQSDFSRILAGLRLAEDVECRTAGPWPPTEFLAGE